jgi:hypothetical protein
MAKANRVHSTPPINTPISQNHDGTSRRRFLTNAAGLAAGGTTLAQMVRFAPAAGETGSPFEPVFDLIAAHRKADAAVDAVMTEVIRLDNLNEPEPFDLLSGPTTAENDALYALATAVPTTLAGITAMAAYFGEIAEREAWKLDGEVATALIASLAEALSGLAVQSRAPRLSTPLASPKCLRRRWRA